MRSIVLYSCFILPLLVLPSQIVAQYNGCYSSLTRQQCHIKGSSCSSVVNMVSPVPSGYSYVFVPSSCCGVQMMVPYTQQGSCYIAELKEPETQKNLLLHAQRQQVLIANCDGYLRPLPRLTRDELPTRGGSGFSSPDQRLLIPKIDLQ